MTRNIKYTSEKVFCFQGKSTKNLFEQIRNYIHFSAATFRFAKGMKIPGTTILYEPTKLKKLLDNAVEIEFNCVSDDALKESLKIVMNTLSNFALKWETNHHLSIYDIIQKLENERENYRRLQKQYDTNSRLYFNSSITILATNGSNSLAIPRYEYEQIEDSFHRGYLISNIEIRREFVQEIIIRINDRINKLTNQNTQIRPIVASSKKMNSRFVNEYVEMLVQLGYINASDDKKHLSNILGELLNVEKTKLSKDKNDYSTAKKPFNLLITTLNKLDDDSKYPILKKN